MTGCHDRFGGRRGVSIQITILKVLAGHPGGCLAVADLTRCVSFFISSGKDWTAQMKRLTARAPDIDIFRDLMVERSDRAWQITERGRQFLASLEAPLLIVSGDTNTQEAAEPGENPSSPLLRLVVDNDRPLSIRLMLAGLPADLNQRLNFRPRQPSTSTR